MKILDFFKCGSVSDVVYSQSSVKMQSSNNKELDKMVSEAAQSKFLQMPNSISLTESLANKNVVPCDEIDCTDNLSLISTLTNDSIDNKRFEESFEMDERSNSPITLGNHYGLQIRL